MIARPISKPGRATLLYVEEQAENVALVQALLADRKDLRLLHAASVALGVKVARARLPEAILVDLDLECMGALELMKALRADPATEATPILALGATATPEAVVKALQAGFFQVLAKPLRMAPFMEALDFALEFVAVERAEGNPLLLRLRKQKGSRDGQAQRT